MKLLHLFCWKFCTCTESRRRGGQCVWPPACCHRGLAGCAQGRALQKAPLAVSVESNDKASNDRTSGARLCEVFIMAWRRERHKRSRCRRGMSTLPLSPSLILAIHKPLEACACSAGIARASGPIVIQWTTRRYAALRVPAGALRRFPRSPTSMQAAGRIAASLNLLSLVSS